MEKNKGLVKKAKDMEWSKDWETPTSIFGLDMTMDAYFRTMQEEFGYTFKNILIDHKAGISGCYISDDDINNFGSLLLERFESDQGCVDDWCDKYKDLVDRANDKMRNAPSTLVVAHIDQDMYDLISRTGSVQIAIKGLAGMLHEESQQDHVGKLGVARKYGEKIYYDLSECIDMALRSIVKQTGYIPQAIGSMTLKEMKEFLHSKTILSEEMLLERYNSCGVYFSSQGSVLFSDEQIAEILDALTKKHNKESGLMGITAYKGKVHGRCRVIKDFNKDNKMRKGDVLVTGMTNPYYLSLMKDSSAIVTDGGGVLCHAAIVARELKKPCIIGTKIATKVLKDGDMVEVDADKGIVRII